MSLPASQQRVLDRIEDAFKKREPRLASMFAMFTRLNTHEGLPRTEALVLPPWWSPRRWSSPRRRSGPLGRARAAVLLALATALVVAAVFFGMSQSRTGCNGPILVHGPSAQTARVNCPAAAQANGAGHGP